MGKVAPQKEMILLSDQEYYHKLDNILLGSLEYLRQVFKNKWKSETGDTWLDDMGHGDKFKEVCKKAYKIAPNKTQKMKMEENISEWDMTTLSLVIQNFGCEEKYKKENDAVRDLKNVTNNALAHNANKKLSQQKYLENVQIFRSNLQILGMNEENIAKIIELAGITSSLKALDHMALLHNKARKLMKNGQIKEAFKFFSESINVPSLLPINLGTAYEKRAKCLLSQVKDPLKDKDKCSAALLDAEKAIELNEYSWMGHYLVAQCYRWQNKLYKAISHYEKALAISPARDKVRVDYDTCKLLAGEHSRESHLDPRSMPKTLEQLLADLKLQSGIEISKEDYIHLQIEKGKVINGQDLVFRGHQHFHGWDVSQNFTEAIKYYATAANLKNAEGLYNLAVCYHYGHGAEQNIHKAMELYRQVAEMAKDTPGDLTILKCNQGVASAQHAIGLLYHEGVLVEQDYALAAFWYNKAMENGVGQAANNLGHLYANGKGMPQDGKMAEFCWKQAINLRSTSAPASLMIHYVHHMEPDRAADMLRIGREMGNFVQLRLKDAEFNRQVDIVKAKRLKMEPAVVEFEQANNLSSKGFTFKERLNRKNAGFLHSGYEKVEKSLERFISGYNGEQVSWGGQIQKITPDIIQSINEKAKQGSGTACRILKTLTLYTDILELFEYTEEDASLAEKIVDAFYTCVKLEFHVLFFDVIALEKLQAIVEKRFKENGEVTGEDDMKARLCYAVFNLSGSMKWEDLYAVQILEEGIRRYSDNVHYYEYLSEIFANKGLHTKAIFYAKEGLKRFPDNYDLIYCLATELWKQSENIAATTLAECVAALKRFLELAPKDHRKVPEAYYQISSFFVMDYNREEKIHSLVQTELLERIKGYFCLGQEAEKNQLACYLPYGESEVKCLVKSFLVLVSGKDEESVPEAVSNVEEAGKELGILERKPYLLSPARKSLVLAHRRNLNKMHTKMTSKNDMETTQYFTLPSKLKQTVAKRLANMKPITLQEMNPTQDEIYQDRILDLTIMDELNPYFPSIGLIAEDDNGDMIRLYVYNVEKNKETLAKFQPGCTVNIINPYIRIGGYDNTCSIRNDEPGCIVFLEKVENMCRFCGEGKATRKCAKCKRPYCSRECQKLDWTELSHKLICSIKF